MDGYRLPELPAYDSQHPEFPYPAPLPDHLPGDTPEERVNVLVDALHAQERVNLEKLRAQLLEAVSGSRGAPGVAGALTDHAVKDWHLRHHGAWEQGYWAVKRLVFRG